MANTFESDPPLSNPSPKSGIESRLIKADLDKRIAASGPKRPRIGALPTPLPNPEAKREEPVDEMPIIEPLGSNPDEEPTANTRAIFVIPRQPPVRK